MCSPMGNNRPAHWLKETMGSRILDSWAEWSIYDTACVLQGLMSNNVYCVLSCDRLSELVFQISSLSFSKQYSFKAVFLLTLWSFEASIPLGLTFVSTVWCSSIFIKHLNVSDSVKKKKNLCTFTSLVLSI